MAATFILNIDNNLCPSDPIDDERRVQRRRVYNGEYDNDDNENNGSSGLYNTSRN